MPPSSSPAGHCGGIPANKRPSSGRAGVYHTGFGASRSSGPTAARRGVAVLCFVAALAVLLPTATPLLDYRSTPACDCEGAVLVERQLLQAEHTRLVRSLTQTCQDRIAQLEGLLTTLGGGTSTTVAVVGPDVALLPRVAVAPDNGPAGGARPPGLAARLGELRKSAPSRGLLQTERFCSMDELMSVQKDAVAAVTGMLTTNPGCAMCLIPCAAAENPVGCAMPCVKQVPESLSPAHQQECNRRHSLQNVTSVLARLSRKY